MGRGAPPHLLLFSIEKQPEIFWTRADHLSGFSNNESCRQKNLSILLKDVRRTNEAGKGQAV